MISFFIGITILVLGYVFYGAWVERTFGVDAGRTTPALSATDGVDFVPIGTRRNALIQLLNIAGVGPIFGPILGALYGPVAFIWIALGAVFAGGVHDYLIGMISIRNRGAHLPKLAGLYLGNGFRHVVNFFCLLLLLLVGTVFVTAPARLIFDVFDGHVALFLITVLIFVYYLVATILPVDKVIGRIYPVLGAFLVLCSSMIAVMLMVKGWSLPEWGTVTNSYSQQAPVFPLLFLTISCGALSGFHATQTPIIARTLTNEKHGRPVFYGMMILEGIIAMIWCAGALALKESGLLEGMLLGDEAVGPAGVVQNLALRLLGPVLGTAAVISVIILPISSGDTAFRSSRMIIGDYLKWSQSKMSTRLTLAVPIFIISILLTFIDFSLLWRYFSWANQALAAVTLWTASVYLKRNTKCYWLALLPALFITSAVLTYILYMPIGLGLSYELSWVMGGSVSLLGAFVLIFRKV